METFIPMQDIMNRIKLNNQLSKEDREGFGFHTNRQKLSQPTREKNKIPVKKNQSRNKVTLR